MTHNMRLNDKPFNLIKDGTKTIELRLNDEKRQLIQIGDYIIFENRTTAEQLKTRVINLHKYDSFKTLYKHFDKILLGYQPNESADPEDMEEYYSKEEQNKYGVVGIEIAIAKEQKK